MGIEQEIAEAERQRNGRMDARTLREAIFARGPKLKREAITAFDQSFYVQELTSEQRDQYEASIAVMRQNRQNKVDVEFNRINVRARLVAMVCVDEHGARIFSDDDAEALGKFGGNDLDKLFTLGRKLSGMSDEDVEELEGN